MQGERSLSELTLDVASQMGDLVRNEVRLARAEALEGLKHVGGGIVRAAIGVAFAGAAVTLGLFSIGYAIGESLPTWAGALIAAAIGGLIAFVLIKSGLKAASLDHVDFSRTMQSVSRDISITKERI